MQKIRLVTFLLSLTALTASAMPFADTVNHPFVWQIDKLRVNGIISGYNNSIFRPDNPINRAEFLKILMLAVYGDEALSVANRRCFPDFFGEEQWFWIYACAAKERGIVEGYPDGSFNGLALINTAEGLKMSIEAWDIPLPVFIRAPDNWYDPYLIVAAERGVWNVLPQHPGHFLSRGEMAAMMVALGENIAVVQGGGSQSSQVASVPGSNAVCGNGEQEVGEQCDDGNLENEDGCSQICVSVPEPVRHAVLKIEQKTQGTSANAQGTKDVMLMRFTAVAGSQDVTFTGLKLKAQSGNLSAAKQYRLLMDASGDDRAETLVAFGKIDGGMLVFSGMKRTLEEGVQMTFEVHGDMEAVSGGTSTVQLGFAVSDKRFVEAIGVTDGRDLSGIEVDSADCGQSVCWIAVTTASAQNVTVKDTGNLYVRKDSEPIPSHQFLLGDEGSKPMLHLTFAAEEEDIVVTGITLGGATDSIDRLQFYDREGGTSFADARTSECETPAEGRFCAVDNDGLLTVPRGAERDVYVYAIVKSDADGGSTGDSVTLTLAATGTPFAILARGAGSEKTLAQNDGDTTAEGEIFIGRREAGANIAVVGSTHDLVAATIEDIANIASDPDQTPVPLGSNAFGVFRFTAGAHDNSRNGLDAVHITELVFTVSASNVAVDSDSFELFNADNPAATTLCIADKSTGTITVTCSDLDESDMSAVIEQAGFIDLGLQGDIALIDTTGAHTLQASLNLLSDRTRTGTITWEDDIFPFQWVDIGKTQVKSTLYKTP